MVTLAERAGGNPFLVNQLLAAMRVSGQILVQHNTATVVGEELPSSFVAAVDQRLRGLSIEARRLLTVGSIFGRAFAIHEAARLAGVPAAAMTAAANEALDSGLIVESDHRLDFAHDLLRQAVYDHVPKPVLSAMHRVRGGGAAGGWSPGGGDRRASDAQRGLR